MSYARAYLGQATPPALPPALPSANPAAGDVAPPPAVALLTPAVTAGLQDAVRAGLAPVPPQAPFSIIPSECKNLAKVRTAPNPVPAGQTVVMAYPMVTLTDEQVGKVLAQITDSAGQPGPALVENVARWKVDRSVPVPSFVASGWMRDTESDQTKTRGVLWLAMSWPASVSFSDAGDRGLNGVMKAAITKAGVSPGAPLMNASWSPVKGNGSLVVCDDTSDQALEAAALQSAVGVTLMAELLARVFGLRSGSKLTANANALSQTFQRGAASCVAALQTLNQVPAMAAQADAMATAALSGLGQDGTTPPPPAPVVQTEVERRMAIMNQLRSALLQAKANILAGTAAAGTVAEWAAREGQPDANLAKTIRDTVVKDVEAELAAIQLAPGREYRKCIIYTQAQRLLDGMLTGIATSMAAGSQAAAALLANREAIAAAMTTLDAAVARVDYAISQLPLSWLEKDLLGVPMYAWLGGGAVLLIGGALVVRAVRKRKTVTPNRRRLTSRRRR